jgi:hypothetical protein
MNTCINDVDAEQARDEMIEQMTAEQKLLETPLHSAVVEDSRYYKIAMPMLEKGFTVWPVKPEPEKTGEYGWNTLAYFGDEVVHRCLAKKFPNHNAAVISKRGVGNLMFLDIDSAGVLERIENETGQNLSGTTYSVCSRPQSAPYKRHFYFRQTARSVRAWRMEANVRDITEWSADKNGNPIHPTVFDVKGVGGGGYVIAPGSVRTNGEAYTVIDDLPVIDVPDWLVNWLSQEIKRWNSGRRKEQIEHAQKVNALSKSEQSALQKAGDPNGFKYPSSEIYAFMNWRAAILARNAVSKKNIARQLTEEINRDFAGGKEYTAGKRGQEGIRRMIASKKLGVVNWNWVGPKKKAILCDGSKLMVRQTRHSLMVAAMKKFPKSVTASDGYDRLQEALIGTVFHLVNGRAAEKAVAQVRKGAGYFTQRTKDGWIWIKPPNEHVTTTHIQ